MNVKELRELLRGMDENVPVYYLNVARDEAEELFECENVHHLVKNTSVFKDAVNDEDVEDYADYEIFKALVLC